MKTNIREEAFEYCGKRMKKKKDKRNSDRFFLGLILASIMMIAAMMSPLFAVKEVIITPDDLAKLTPAEVKTISGIDNGKNIFMIHKKSAINALKENPYVEGVVIQKQLPSTVYIDVLERKVRGYVEYMGSYLYIDEFGRVLDIQTYHKDALPLVIGLEFDSFQLGEKIDAINKDALDVVVMISQVMTKYEMLDLVVTLDVSETKSIKARVNNIDVNLGSISDCDEKIRTMAAIIKEIPEGDRGTLDLSDLSKPFVFKYLT